MKAGGQLLAALLGSVLRLNTGGTPPSPNPRRAAPSFKEAIAWHKERTAISDADFRALEASARRKAFTIANVAQLDTVVHVHGSIAKALEKGTGYADWKKDIGSELNEAWKGTVRNPAWRTELIFRNATQTAYNGGRFIQATRPDVLDARPFWRFDGIRDSRECPICESCNGIIRRADDPWWKTHLGPLHHACRCSFTTLTAEQAADAGLTDDEQLAETEDADEGFGGTPDKADWTDAAYEERRASAPAETEEAEKKQVVEDAHVEAQPPAAPPPAVPPRQPPSGGGGTGELPGFEPAGTPVSQALKVDTDDPLAATFGEALKAIDSVHGAGELPSIPLRSVTAGPPGLYVYDKKTQVPTGIEILQDQGYPALNTVHEVGHFVDQQALWHPGGWASLKGEKAKAIVEKLLATKAAKTYRKTAAKAFVWTGQGRFREKVEITPRLKGEINRYWLNGSELFARAYAQWVVLRSASPVLQADLTVARARPMAVHMPEYWGDREFEPIAEMFDEFFEARGWMQRPQR